MADAIRTLSLAIERWRSTFARKYGLVDNDVIVLGHLSAAGGRLLPREIAAVMELRTGTVTAMLDRLELAGFIARTPNPDDRRSTLVDLTPRGQRAIDEQLQFIEKRMRAGVPSHARAEVTGYLNQVAGIVSSAADDTRSA